ncbi:MAG: SDR family NAD(P)-dependent oxidoreductase [Chlorobi bacterium]|nr:MAG: SDR family NAD(P)-dependent oxidoreductase [Bacteroidota bacterium]MBE2266064.1 SDR family NAD(P)-dependent oxidoreductase [Flavobacteriales bacterium]MBL1160793.1 SDR family NAD(P)-dependent oxidoreductase [Chlorobiota bacterium]MBW7853144.1 SDR family NAD(P)-dependent oxidoreductase [Candidatus Kapabacteria bacterium]MCC6331367.1 SDR family NAD(P)-dependent oxidoreductase [Ignavibacteria bacterium]
MKSVIVTGATGGLGTIVTQHLRTIGWNVITVNGRTTDLTRMDAVERFVASVAEPVTGLVHLVGGILPAAPVHTTTIDDFNWYVAVNLTTTYTIVRAMMPRLIQSGSGSIVTIGAYDALHQTAHRSLYAATKSAVVAFTKAIAEEGKPDNIRANVIVPSIIRTPANLEWGDADEVPKWVDPGHVAQTIEFLLSPSCGLNGAVLTMPGGLTL